MQWFKLEERKKEFAILNDNLRFGIPYGKLYEMISIEDKMYAFITFTHFLIAD